MRVKPFFLLLLLLVVAFSGCDASRVAHTQDPPGGREIFLEYCAACHGLKGQGQGGELANGRINFSSPDWQLRMSDEAIRMTVRNGRNVMPAFGSRFSDEEMDKLVGYIRSLPESSGE